jgi:hypothetical protein
MTKKMECILFFSFFCISNIVANQPLELEFVKGKVFYKLPLPYEITGKKAEVFDGDPPFAIGISKIEIDGKAIVPEPDGSSREFLHYRFETRKVKKGEETFYISMYWYKYQDGRLSWNDGKGKNLGFSYMIKPGSRVLKIKYRIIIPYPFITIAFYNDRIPEWAYTQEYEAIVDLANTFGNETK